DILGMSSNAMLTEFYGALSKNNAKEALTIIHNLHDQGTDLKQFIHEFIDSLRQKMLKMISENKEDGVGRILEMLDILSEAKLKQDIDIPQLPYEVAVLQITGKLVKKAIIEEDEIEEEVTVKAPVQEAKPEKKLEEKEDVASGDFNLKLLKEKWPRVMERIKVPSLRMSLKNALPEKVEGLDVELSFSTNFHKAKVMEHDNRVELEKVIEDVFSKKIKLNARVKEMELKTVMEEDLDRMQSEPKPKPEVEDALDQALNIFGGELVE
ncbi:hypothetical protein KJ632_03740, partial [Patescibacteria group bacterium]|nr:hypothetical protein [Patescibacteria group bacterium]